MDAIAACLVTGGGNHAAFFRRARDDERFAAPLGVVALLNRGVEGIHVDVDDFAGHGGRGIYIAILTRSRIKACCLRLWEDCYTYS